MNNSYDLDHNGNITGMASSNYNKFKEQWDKESRMDKSPLTWLNLISIVVVYSGVILAVVLLIIYDY